MELSVALPIYRGKYIAWLALESLCRQKNIDFEWELVVIEEEYECFSEESLMGYSDRLAQVGCKRIFYKQLDKWIPLYMKWKAIAKNTSPTSKAFLLKAADCYSQPYRLRETYDILVKQEYDWVASLKGPFYDILSELLVIYDDRSGKKVGGLNMAIKPHFIRNMPDANIFRQVDGSIIKAARELCRKNKLEFKNTYNNSENWKYGVDTNGLNNISFKRMNRMKNNPNGLFREKTNLTIDEVLPKDIILKLKDCKKHCRKEYVKINDKYSQ